MAEKMNTWPLVKQSGCNDDDILSLNDFFGKLFNFVLNFFYNCLTTIPLFVFDSRFYSIFIHCYVLSMSFE